MAGLIPVVAVSVVIVFLAAGAKGAEGRQKLPVGATSTVKEVIDGDTVVLDPPIGGADQVRLVSRRRNWPSGARVSRRWHEWGVSGHASWL